MVPSDDELVAAAVDGETACLDALLKKYGPQVHRRLQIDPAWRASLDAADVMQVTYLEAFLGVGQLESRQVASFVAWLTRIAENNLRDAVKELKRTSRPDPRRRVQPRTVEESSVMLLDALGCTTATGSRTAARHEAHRFLHAAIQHLPGTYQRVVRLYDLEGQSAQQVGETIGRSPGAVYMLRARAHDRLREILGSSSRFFSDSA